MTTSGPIADQHAAVLRDYQRPRISRKGKWCVSRTNDRMFESLPPHKPPIQNFGNEMYPLQATEGARRITTSPATFINSVLGQQFGARVGTLKGHFLAFEWEGEHIRRFSVRQNLASR